MKKYLHTNYAIRMPNLFILNQIKNLGFQAMLILSLFILISNSTNAQSKQLNEQFRTITEDGSELEFFTIKSDLNFSKEEFLSKHLQMLNLTQNSEMRFVRTSTNDIGITSTFYQQYLNNHKVKGCEMVINEKAGRVKYVYGRYLQSKPLNSQIAISKETALQTALSQIESKNYLWLQPEAEAAYRRFKGDSNATYKPEGELMYVSSSLDMREIKDFRLVWNYKIHVSPQIESYEFFIDASTGEIVNKIPLTFDCSAGTSTTLWNGARTIYTVYLSILNYYYTVNDCSSAQVYTYNGNGNDNGTGATFYSDADNNWPSTDLGKYIAQTHWGSRQTRNYYANIHNREGYDGAGANFITYLNPGYTGNAYWTGAGTSFGGSSTGANPYVTLDVCGHEHTHGMIDYTSNLTYSYESGALNESFADCIGEAVEEYSLGSADWIHRNEIGGGNRSFINPNAKGDPDTYLGTNWYTGSGDNGGVHINSGVQNYWFYLLSVGGSGTNDNGNSFNVSGITIDKARMIAYDCMIGLISSSQYANARSVSIQKAKDRYGDCANEVVQCTNAWRAVGVGSAYIAPLPLTINISATSNDICKGNSVTLTASGASTYAWDPGTATGSSATFSPTSTTIYTVTGTNSEQCTGSKTKTIIVNELPTVNPSTNDNELCSGQSTILSSGSNQTLNSLETTLAGGNGLSGNVFDVHAYNNITITDFTMNLQFSVDSVEIYYNPGGYGNANVTSNTGWSKLGQTVAVISAGPGALTTIPTTTNLTIAAGSTYGILILCNGSNIYTNGTLVGSIAASNSDLYITEGHGGNGFGGTFNFTISPRVFNGSVVYRTNFTNYSWSPSSTLSSATTAATVATPTSSTTYTLTATDGNGCSNTGSVKVYRYSNPSINTISATPSSICAGETSQLNNFPVLSNSSQSLFTTLEGGNGSSGNVFDIHAINNITITNIRMHILAGDSAQVWYKTSPYGNSSLLSSSGWTKLGNTVAITAAGSGALTLIPTSANLVIPAGSTYGIAVVCNGINNYTNGTAVGTVAYSSPDLEITEGHGGTGFNGAFSFVNSPRVFNGQIDYTVNNAPMNFSWSPSASLTNSTIQNPVASPKVNTTYTLTITDAHGCKDTAYKKLYVNQLAELYTNVIQSSICPGDSAQINSISGGLERDSLFTTLANNNSNGGNVFDIITSKSIIIKSLKMNISAGATQAEVWYKNGGYGNASFSGTSGWTKLGSTVAITPAGIGYLTDIPITTSLTILGGTTMGLLVVCNGTANYTDATSAVGSIVESNEDFSLTVGHGGTGIGSYNFSASPRIWNGEIVYDAINSIVGYSWAPNSNINNNTIFNPKVAPSSTTIYTITITDINGCTTSAGATVNVSPLPQLGTATASPSSICLGSNLALNYAAPVGLGCFGAIQTGFSGTYSPANWTLTQIPVGSNGTVNTLGAPVNVYMTSSNGASGSGSTNYTITIPCDGVVSFNWNYTTIDSGPQYDYPRYSINGGIYNTFPGFVNQSGAPKTQNGEFNLPVTAGQTFTFSAYSTDNVGGPCTISITNFQAPYQTFSGQSVVWYNNASGGSAIGNGNPQNFIPTSTGSKTYYAQISSSITGCTNTTRAATNSVAVNPIPNVTTTATSTTICAGASTNISASGATTYIWNPGGLTGTTASVNPASTTTYTIIGTNTAGCTNTSTRTITVTPCSNTLALTLLIQGYYAGAGTMTPVKANEGVGSSSTIVDDIDVEIHNPTAPYAFVTSAPAVLMTNGSAVANFSTTLSGPYYIVIKHRNGVETWSGAPYNFGASNSYNFTNLANKAYGSNQIQMDPNKWAIYSGDVSQDGSVDIFDFLLWDFDNQNFANGYLATDFNGDGNVDIFDFLIWDPNNQNFVGVIAP